MNIVVAGSTGQVGKEIIKALSESEHTVWALVRRSGTLPAECGAAIKEVVFNFDEPSNVVDFFRQHKADVLIIALGTTMKTAGSVDAFNKVDRDYPIQLIEAFVESDPSNLNRTIALVSSVGADNGLGTYLKAKHAVEERIFKTGLRHIIARPSFLLSQRSEVRPAEIFVEKVVAKPYLFLTSLLPDSKALWKYAPVHVSKVAHAIVNGLLKRSENLILEGKDLQ